MITGLTWPLLTSVLRLIFISTLTVVNWLALYKVVASKKVRSGRRQENVLVTTIIVVSLVYLTVVWAPFTFSALRHDLADLQQRHGNRKADIESKLLSIPELRVFEGDTLTGGPKDLKEDELTVEYIDFFPSLEAPSGGAGDQPEEEFVVEYVELTKGSEENTKVEDEEEFVVEYIDLATGETMDKLPPSSGKRKTRDTTNDQDLEDTKEQNLEASWTVFYHSQPDFQPDISLSPLALKPTEGSFKAVEKSEGRYVKLSWSSDAQDFITSSCAYSLAFTAVVRLVIMKRLPLFFEGPWALGLWSGLVVGVPGAITLLIRSLAKSTNYFAPHQPEYTATGYFLYNIICDVHISEGYVVSVFLEWAALFTLLVVVLGLLFTISSRKFSEDFPSTCSSSATSASESYGHLEEEGDTSSHSNVEAWARDVVLTIAAVWSWPAKPVLVLVLFCMYGAHWTNVVCWLAHVVVAIPVVFIPLAVFLTRFHDDKSPPKDVYVIEDDPRLSQELPQEKREVDSKPEDIEETRDRTQDEGPHRFTTEGQTESFSEDAGRGHARENLKFYLGKDVFKYGLKGVGGDRDDKQIILDNQYDDSSISEA